MIRVTREMAESDDFLYRLQRAICNEIADRMNRDFERRLLGEEQADEPTIAEGPHA